MVNIICNGAFVPTIKNALGESVKQAAASGQPVISEGYQHVLTCVETAELRADENGIVGISLAKDEAEFLKHSLFDAACRNPDNSEREISLIRGINSAIHIHLMS